MRNRPARWLVTVLAGLLVLCAMLMASGCKRSAAPVAGQQPQDPNALVLQQLKQYQEESGKNMAALMDELKRQQSLQESKAGDPPLVRDLATARFFLTDAKQAAEARSTESMGPALRILQRVTSNLASDLPAARIAQHLDRAVYLIRNQQAIGSKEYAGASLELLAASEAAVNGRPAVAVPDVLKDIQAAKAAADRGIPAEALQSAQAALTAIASHPLGSLLNRAQAAVRGAQAALDRQAWPVVTAELAELDGVLSELSKIVEPQTAADEAKAAAQKAAPADASAAAPVAPAVAPAVPPSTPPAQPAAPANGAQAPAGAPAAAPVAPAPAPAQQGAAPAPQPAAPAAPQR
ncbi:MAG: hypothetical protein ACYC63_06945 [Armatimonadota bacterium]